VILRQRVGGPGCNTRVFLTETSVVADGFTASRFTLSRLTASRLTASSFTAYRLTAFVSIVSRYSASKFPLQSCSIMAWKCITQQTQIQLQSISASNFISKLTQSRPPGVSRSSHNLSGSRCIFKLPTSRSPNASLGLQDHSPQEDLLPCSITTSKYIFHQRLWAYGDTVVTEVDRVTGSISSADLGVHKDHLMSISCYLTTNIHTLDFPTLSLTQSGQEFVDLCNCMDPQCGVVSYLLTRFLNS